MKQLIAAAAVVLTAIPAAARSVSVKYHGNVEVDDMYCEQVDRSSFINEVCYHQPTGYMLISLKGTFYQYCALDAETHAGLMSASSMGRFYNSQIKGGFDCRLHGAPEL